MLLYSNNNTLQWLDSLDVEKKAKVMESARKNAPDVLAKYRLRKANIKTQLIALLQTRQEEKLVKEKKAADTRGHVTNDIMKYGGLWKTKADMDRHIDLSNEKLTLLAVKAQIRFRKLILNSRQVDKTLLSFSKDGKASSLQTLITNLETLMQATASGSDVNQDLQHEPAKTQTFKVKSKKEREKCMAEHRTQSKKKNLNLEYINRASQNRAHSN